MSNSTTEQDLAASVAFDWADKKHAGALSRPAGMSKPSKLEQSPQSIDDWAAKLRQRFGRRPVAVCLEQSKGALIYALMKYDFFVLYPINPKQLSSFREAMGSSRAKRLVQGLASQLLALIEPLKTISSWPS